MSRIEDALRNAVAARSSIGKKEIAINEAGVLVADNSITVLIVSSDLSISCLARNLGSLACADIVVAEDIARGMKSFQQTCPLELNDFEVRFTALMLDTLCCCYGQDEVDVVTG